MEFTALWLDVTFVARFATPLIRLAMENVRLLEALHHQLARFQIPTSDLLVAGGQSMGDVSVLIRAFNRRGELRVTVDELSASFTSIREPADFQIVREFTEHAERGVSSVFQHSPLIGRRTLSANGHLKLQSEAPVRAFFEHFLALDVGFNPKALGADQLENGVVLKLQNVQDGWDGRLLLERSELEEADIFFSASVRFDEVGRAGAFGDRLAFSEQLLLNLLAQCGLRAATETQQA